MSRVAPIIVRSVKRFRAPPGRVFDAWFDPVCAAKWLFATEGGEMIRAEIDPRVGGRFLFIDRRKGVDAAHYGVYREIDRPRRLVFSFSVADYDVDAALVTVAVAPTRDGCELTLTQTLAPEWAAYKDRAEKGWGMILEGLAEAL